MSAILDAIRENLRKIQIVFEPTETSFKADTKQTGDAKELTVRYFLESFFPSTYKVRKGLIYSQEGVSREIDCVLLAPNHPPLVTPVREVIIAEGVHAAIEVKPDISTLSGGSEFYRGLMQVQSVKRLKREIAHLPTNEFPAEHEIPCAIFSGKSRPLKETVDFMVSQVDRGVILPIELPDMIVTLDNGLLFHSASLPTSIFRKYLASKKQNHAQRGFIHFGPEHDTLALFLLILYSVTPPEPHYNHPILTKYLGFRADEAMFFEY